MMLLPPVNYLKWNSNLINVFLSHVLIQIGVGIKWLRVPGSLEGRITKKARWVSDSYAGYFFAS